jgi:hypothetical protein
MYLLKILYITVLVFAGEKDIREETNIKNLNDDMNYVIDNIYSYLKTKANSLQFNDIYRNFLYTFAKFSVTKEEKERFARNYRKQKEYISDAKKAIVSIINTNNIGFAETISYGSDYDTVSFIIDILYDIKDILTEENKTIAIKGAEILKDRLITNNVDLNTILDLIWREFQFYIENKNSSELTFMEKEKVISVVGPLLLEDIKTYINSLDIEDLPSNDEEKINNILLELINKTENIKIHKIQENKYNSKQPKKVITLIVIALSILILIVSPFPCPITFTGIIVMVEIIGFIFYNEESFYPIFKE